MKNVKSFSLTMDIYPETIKIDHYDGFTELEVVTDIGEVFNYELTNIAGLYNDEPRISQKVKDILNEMLYNTMSFNIVKSEPISGIDGVIGQTVTNERGEELEIIHENLPHVRYMHSDQVDEAYITSMKPSKPDWELKVLVPKVEY